jgi:hypothetical protein
MQRTDMLVQPTILLQARLLSNFEKLQLERLTSTTSTPNACQWERIVFATTNEYWRVQLMDELCIHTFLLVRLQYTVRSGQTTGSPS